MFFMKKFLALIFLSAAFLYGSQAEAVIRIGAYQFWISSGSGVTYNWVNNKYEKLFSDMLSKTGLFELIPVKRIMEIEDALIKSGREPNGLKSLTEAGRMEKCRYLLTQGRIVLQKDLSSAEIDFQLIDILTEEVIPIKESISLQPSSENTSSPERAKSSRSKKSSPKQKQNKTDAKAVKEQLIAQAFNRTVERLLEDIAENSPMVTEIKGNSILLNRGSAVGLKPGDIYRVYAETSGGTEDIFGTDYTESMKTDLALVQIKDVMDNSSTAEIFQNAGNINAIHIGDKVAAVSSSEAQRIISEIPSGQLHSFSSKDQKIAVTAPSSQENASSAVASLPPLSPGTIRIGIVKFENKADNVLDKEAGAITDLCTRFLSTSDKIAVIEKDRLDAIAREHRLNLSGAVDISTAAQLGKYASCQYVLMGSITDMGESRSESSNYVNPNDFKGSARDVVLGLGLLQMLIGGGITEKEERNMSVTIDARVVNVVTGKVEFALQETGWAKQISVSREKGFKTVTRGGIQSQAIDYAAANLGLEVRAKLTEEYPRISAVNGDEIIVNIGSSSGVHVGDLLCTIGAVLSVKEVQPDFSITELIFAASENRRPGAGSLIIPCLYNDFDKDVLITVAQKVEKDSNDSTPKRPNTSSANMKPVKFDKSRFELSSTDAKKVIMSYGLNKKEEKKLLDAHLKASKISNARKKYEAYVKLAQSTLYDYLASYNAAKYALELSMLKEAEEWADQALLINPEYKPAKTLMAKIKRSK